MKIKVVEKIENKLKNINLKYIHIAVIIIGIIFISLSIFHTNQWFDESYSVGIVTHSIKDIWRIGSTDVHPVLYYLLLHVVELIFGKNVIMFRVFSVICMAILGILGFTHIKKDFGEKAGLLFTTLVYFLPVNLVYAGEIRMYSLAMLLVTLMAIYAYRICKNTDSLNIKNWILFAIFSLSSAYTHYYALMAAGIINFYLMVCLIVKSVKAKKFNKNLIAFIISGVLQVILYLPWVVCLLSQVKEVSKGFWINLKFPDTIIQFFVFQFVGNLENTKYVTELFGGIFGLIIISLVIYLAFRKNKSKDKKVDMMPAIISISIYTLIILAAWIVTKVIKRPIIYARYMLCVGGLFTFFMAYIMANKGNKYINTIVISLIVIVSIIVNVRMIKTDYSKLNDEPYNLVASDIEPNDIFLFGNEGSGFVMAQYYPSNKAYFYDKARWNKQAPYEGFQNEVKTIYELDDLADFHGRIWIVNSDDHQIYNELKEKYDVKVLKQEKYQTLYKQMRYALTLVEK